MTQAAVKEESKIQVPVEVPSYALDIVGLSKRFKRQTLRKAGYTTIKSSLLEFFSKRPAVSAQDEQFTHAIRDLTLRIPRGASVGIIGRNGSGKSTFLKLVTGIYKPDAGEVKVNGRLAALIELGAGFHPDFTGRENLYLAGVMHGLTRQEIDERFVEIVKFAELAEVIDDPVRTYSSGMYMRLGFSLAIHTDPDVLLVDEVLAVGDAAFVSKCKERIAKLRKEGKTLLLVTHDLDAVERWCDEALWLNRGVVKDRGEPRRVIDHYRQFIEKGEEDEFFEAIAEPTELDTPTETTTTKGEAASGAQRWGSREIEVRSVRIVDRNNEVRMLLHSDQSVAIEIDYINHAAVTDVVFGIAIHRSDGLLIHGSNTEIERIELGALGQRGTIRYEVDRLSLLDGNYLLDVAVHRQDGYPYDYQKSVVEFGVRWPFKQAGVFVPKHEWKLLRGRVGT